MSEKHVIRGILAGAAGGLVASWVMNEFMAGPGAKISEAVESDQDKQQLAGQSDGEDATMKAADLLTATATRGQHLTHEERATGGPIVHYAFGALMGGAYGAAAEFSSATTAGFGTTFGSALFAGGDLFAVPLFKLSAPLSAYPASSFVTPFLAHLVYGVTTETVRRLVRKVL